MINVEAENVRLWINEHERNDGTKWRTFSISTSSKTPEGDYVNKSLEVRMTRDVQLPADLKNGAICTIMGSLSNRVYTDKNGEQKKEHMLWAREIYFDKEVPAPKGEPADSFSAAEDEIPF